MSKTIISKKDLKEAVREGVSEALASELPKLRASLLPAVSDKEQKDVEERYGEPSGKEARSFNAKI